MKIFITVVVTIAGLAVLVTLYIFLGLFEPGALTPHNSFMLWMIHRTMDVSVEKRADKLNVPEIKDSSMIQTGFAHYQEMCVICHCAPGVEESEIAQGLYPHAPKFYKRANRMDPKETFWIIKNGLKMTGMPAYGKTHTDEQIWAITYFITHKLGKMTAKDFQDWSNRYKSND